MPLYRVKTDELEDLIVAREANGETITQVSADPETVDGFIVVTAKPVNDTGRAWSPSGMKETRA